ncbi:MAG: ATP-binding cassette domain-containing protein [Bacteroides sp.]
METIHLQQALPLVFADREATTSDVWYQDLTFKKGEFYLIEAASGTGKSSLCSYIYGYRNDYQGFIHFDESNICSLSVPEWVELRRYSLSILFQELRVFSELTTWENIQLKNQLTHFKREDEILDLLDLLGLSDKVGEKVGKLSLGQQQRVAFIRCLCQPYDFIFLDEPISHLDDANSRLMGKILTKEAARQEAGVIVTSIGKHIELEYTRVLQL